MVYVFSLLAISDIYIQDLSQRDVVGFKDINASVEKRFSQLIENYHKETLCIS